MSGRAPVLSVANLRTTFSTNMGLAAAVDGIDFTVNENEVLGIVGESGSGKSVTALSVMRLIDPRVGRIAEGTMRFGGIDLAAASQKTMCGIRGNRMSMIFQEPMTALNPVRTIGSQIMEVYRIHRRMKKADARRAAVTMLQKVGIPSPERRVDEYPHQMSGGMRQRAMIAMALALEPELLIADEPTTALDVTIQAQILDLMKAMQQAYGTAILLITHDLGIVSDVAHRVMVMYAGQIVEIGSRDQVFGNMRHPYTVGLMHSIPSIQSDREGPLDAIPGMVPSIYGMPDGCRFAPRCAMATAACRAAVPPLLEVSPGHLARCLFAAPEKGETSNV